MAVEGYLLVITATIAVVALVVAVIAMRRLRAYEHTSNESAVGTPTISESVVIIEPAHVVREEPEVRIVEGRVLVAPTNQQVLAATMGKPLVRMAVITAGLQYAFRPEARDRIRRLMRDEYRTRKSMRRKAAREAAWRHQQANSSASVVSQESWS